MEPARADAAAPDPHAAFRAALLGETPSWYVPAVHLLGPSAVGLVLIAGALASLRVLHPLELLTVPAVYVLANAVEWWVHRVALHRRHPLAPVLYEQHTPRHHVLYTTDDMAMRDRREYRLVLIPAYGLFLIFTTTLAIAAGVALLGLPNVGALYAATAIAYAVSYEWLHFAYHLPADHPVARGPLVRRLARHHAIHHDPRLMQRWNLNVTVPLWDHVMGTATRTRHPPAGRAAPGERHGALTGAPAATPPADPPARRASGIGPAAASGPRDRSGARSSRDRR